MGIPPRIVDKVSGAEIVFSHEGFGSSFPVCRYGVRLPSGLVHPFASEGLARVSQYWPAD